MNTTQITEEQVKAWMLARLAECIGITPHGATSFTLKADNFAANQRVESSCYNTHIGHADTFPSVENSITAFRQKAGFRTTDELAALKREQAAALIAEAEEIETQAAAL